MTGKILPMKKNHHFKKYNCSGKLRVDVLIKDHELSEIILLPEGGGCRHNLQLIGRLLTGMIDCNLDTDFILSMLDKTDPCLAPVSRMNREKLPKEDVGLGGCPKIIAQAIREKLNEKREDKI